ncbi:MAG: DUF4142 domain-containing protein [Gemmatimonadaceae bacterium]
MHRRAGVAMTAIFLSAFVACQSKSDSADAADSAAAPAMRADSASAMTSAAPTLSDAQIAQIVLLANSGDSAHGEMAVTKATNADVKAFGRTMIKDHGELNKQAVALATRLSLTPATSDAATALQADVDNGGRDLMAKSGAEFDRSYIDSEVTVHQKVLDVLDQTLIPQSVNADLKTLLQQARGAIAGHLERAKSLQKKTAM